jgi:hypothetical protein
MGREIERVWWFKMDRLLKKKERALKELCAQALFAMNCGTLNANLGIGNYEIPYWT